MPSSYALGDHFEAFMTRLIEDGRYNSKSEIIRDGLRALEDREEERALKIKALREAVQAGVNSGPGIPMDEVVDRLSAKYKAQIDNSVN